MIQQLFIISRHTFTESIRQPIFVVLILIAILALVLNPSLAAYSLGDDNKLMIDMGFSTLLLTGLLMAVFTATGVLGKELENKTALTVISKPVSRPLFVLGKFAGAGATLTLAFWTLCAVYLLTVRHRVMQTTADPFDGPVLLFGITAGLLALAGSTLMNYFYHRDFTSSFVVSLSAFMSTAWVMVLMIDKQWQFQSPLVDLKPQIMIGLLLIFQAVILLTAVAIAASTRLSQTMTLMVCVLVFGLGLFNDFFFGGIAQQYLVAKVLYALIPNFQFFWPADRLTQGHGISISYIGLVSAYTALYVTALMGLAIGLFQKREIG